jgi:hypothetical protein
MSMVADCLTKCPGADEAAGKRQVDGYFLSTDCPVYAAVEGAKSNLCGGFSRRAAYCSHSSAMPRQASSPKEGRPVEPALGGDSSSAARKGGFLFG